MTADIREREDRMLEWKDVTDTFTEGQRHWKGRYLELCEVSGNSIELSLFSSENEWEVYVNYGYMYGVSYVPADKALQHREEMKKTIEEEYEKHQEKPSDSFVNDFVRKYQLDIMSAFF